MSRNLCKTVCDFCGTEPQMIEKPRPITKEESGCYFDEYAGMLVANADCLACGAKYLGWVTWPDRIHKLHGSLYGDDPQGLVDMSFRSTFNDEPGPEDLPDFIITKTVVVSKTPVEMCGECGKKRGFSCYGCECE